METGMLKGIKARVEAAHAAGPAARKGLIDDLLVDPLKPGGLRRHDEDGQTAALPSWQCAARRESGRIRE
jgi:hypothetical protein